VRKPEQVASCQPICQLGAPARLAWLSDRAVFTKVPEGAC
jgi:hypothetical protein